MLSVYLAAVGMASGGLYADGFACSDSCRSFFKIPPQAPYPKKTDRVLRFLKYLILAILLSVCPCYNRSDYGAGEPFFCKFPVPRRDSGGAGVPLVLLNDVLRPALGWLFRWKMLILILCLVSCVFVYRAVLQIYLPAGSVLFPVPSGSALSGMKVDTGACIHCGACGNACAMNGGSQQKRLTVRNVSAAANV